MALLVPPEDLQINGPLEDVWPLFKQRFLLYLKATGASQWPNDQKVALFLTIAGPDALQLYNSFQLDPKEEEDFEMVLALFEGHCLPRRNETYERFLFRTRIQEPHESLDDFATDLQHKSHFCNFGSQREALVRDQLVLGCRDDHIRQQLLQQEGLTLEDALHICRLAEAKEKGEAQEVQNSCRAQESRTGEKPFRSQVTNRKDRQSQASRRKVRCAWRNSKDYWRQQCDDCLKKVSIQTYV